MNYDHNKKFELLKFYSGYGKFYLNSPKGYSRKIINAQTARNTNVKAVFPIHFPILRLMISVLWLQALAIDTEDDIHLLASYFMQLKGKQAQGDAEEKVRTSVMAFIVIFIILLSVNKAVL